METGNAEIKARPPSAAGFAALLGPSASNTCRSNTPGAWPKPGSIHRRGPWRSFEAVEYATLEWVDRFNNRRLLGPIGNIPPAEATSDTIDRLPMLPEAGTGSATCLERQNRTRQRSIDAQSYGIGMAVIAERQQAMRA